MTDFLGECNQLFFGRLVVWSFGGLVVWSFGRLVVWSFGRLGVWEIGCLDNRPFALCEWGLRQCRSKPDTIKGGAKASPYDSPPRGPGMLWGLIFPRIPSFLGFLVFQGFLVFLGVPSFPRIPSFPRGSRIPRILGIIGAGRRPVLLLRSPSLLISCQSPSPWFLRASCIFLSMSFGMALMLTI